MVKRTGCFAEYLGCIPGPRVVADSRLSLPRGGGGDKYPPLVSEGTGHVSDAQTHMQENTHTYKINIFLKSMALELRMYVLGSNSKSLPKELEHEVRHEASKEEGASSLPVSPFQGNQSPTERMIFVRLARKPNRRAHAGNLNT